MLSHCEVTTFCSWKFPCEPCLCSWKFCCESCWRNCFSTRNSKEAPFSESEQQRSSFQVIMLKVIAWVIIGGLLINAQNSFPLWKNFATIDTKQCKKIHQEKIYLLVALRAIDTITTKYVQFLALVVMLVIS